MADFGVGSGAVRTIAGTMPMHEALEAELAEFKGVPAVLTFQSGFTANTGLIPTITGESDLIVSDSLNHASIIDGMRLSKAPRRIYPHADVDALRAILDEAAADGPLPAHPRRHRRRVQHGRRHRPAARDRGGGRGGGRRRPGRRRPRLGRARPRRPGDGRPLRPHRPGRTSRSAPCRRRSAALGGYVAGPTALREILTQRARPFLFSTSHPPAVVAACRAALRVMQDEPELLERLWANTRRFKAELARLGLRHRPVGDARSRR